MGDSRAALRLAGLQDLSGVQRATGAATRRRRGSGSPLRLLIVRPDHLGDVLLAAPTGRLLAEALPRADIEWLVGPWAADIVRRSGHHAPILTCDFPGFTRRPKRSLLEPYIVLVREARRLRRRQYDAALILRPDHWWGALLAAAAVIPRRFGFAVPACLPFLTDTLPPPTGHVLAASQTLGRLAATRLGGQPLASPRLLDPSFEVTHAERQHAEALRALIGGRPLVAIHPGSGGGAKNWPAARWSAVASALQDRLDARVVLTGGPDEQALIREVAAGVNGAPPLHAGHTTLGELGALFKASDLVLGGDSGPLHIAAAVGSPTVRLYGPTSIGIFGPWGSPTQHRVLQASLPCQPCDNFEAPPCRAVGSPACMRALTVDDVVATVAAMLGDRAGRSAATVARSVGDP
jgi:lipopolysaccharide heptosyltransferase II